MLYVAVVVRSFVLRSSPFIDPSRFTIGERLLLCIIVESAPTGVGRSTTGGGDEGTNVLSLGVGLVHGGLPALMLGIGRIEVEDVDKAWINGGGEIGGENAKRGELNPDCTDV